MQTKGHASITRIINVPDKKIEIKIIQNRKKKLEEKEGNNASLMWKYMTKGSIHSEIFPVIIISDIKSKI